MKTINLYDIELARVTKLHKIAETHEDRRPSETIDTYLEIYRDYVKAANENLEDFQETVDRLNIGVSPVVLEQHLKRCKDSMVADVCLCMPDRATVSQEIL